MTFRLGSERSFGELASVGIAIKFGSDGQHHMGILYRREGEQRFCHLAFHFDLRDEPPRDDYYWDDCGFLLNDPVNGKLLAAKMVHVAKAKKLISYGFHFEGAPFASDGKFVGFPENGMGMTCATFVIGVFHSFGLPILVTATWAPRVDDILWQEKMIALMEKEGAGREHVDAAKSFIGVARYRPEEVAVAAASPTPPLTYTDALGLAAELKRLAQRGSA